MAKVTHRVYDETLPLLAIAPAAARANGTVNGPAIDTSPMPNIYNDATFIIALGALTDGVHTFKAQGSVDAAFTSPVDLTTALGTATATTVATVAADDDDCTKEIGVMTDLQYIRLTCTTSGATTGGCYSAVCVLAAPRHRPTK